MVRVPAGAELPTGDRMVQLKKKRAKEFMCQMRASGERTEKEKEKDKRLVPSVLGFFLIPD